MPIFVTFKSLRLDFSCWPICQRPNQCRLLHNELLIFLIPLPEAAEIYQNTISTFFFPLALPRPLLPRSLLIPERMEGGVRQEASMVDCPGVPLLHGVLVHGVSLNQ